MLVPPGRPRGRGVHRERALTRRPCRERALTTQRARGRASDSASRAPTDLIVGTPSDEGGDELAPVICNFLRIKQSRGYRRHSVTATGRAAPAAASAAAAGALAGRAAPAAPAAPAAGRALRPSRPPPGLLPGVPLLSMNLACLAAEPPPPEDLRFFAPSSSESPSPRRFSSSSLGALGALGRVALVVVLA